MRKSYGPDHKTGIYFEWNGGPYIEVFSRNGKPFTVINVWDYEKDEPTIYPDEFRDRCRYWIREMGDDIERLLDAEDI